jgi:steroid 5-alpha reductase family enzyme
MRMSRRTSLAVLWAAYLWTIAVAWAVGSFLPLDSPLAKGLIVDLVATLMIFVFSVIFDNSSVYDPFWSVAPIFLAGYWVWCGWDLPAGHSRAVAVLVLVSLWGLRLTANFLTRWRGMGHEDWRYEEIRRRTGSAYWIVSLFGIHVLPTLIVFAACVPVFFACTSSRPFGALDVVAAVVTLVAIILEGVADAQMRRAVAAGNLGNRTFRGGLWNISRHPNYVGEIGFWWGLYLFALGADPAAWWTFVGPLAVTILFLTVSLPMIESRMRTRRSDYEAVSEEVAMLIPRFFPRR